MTDAIAPGTEIDVVFAATMAQALGAGLTDPAVVVTPDNSDWNDYSWRVYANVGVIRGGAHFQSMPIRLMFAGALSTAQALAQLFAGSGPVVRVEESPTAFLSILPAPARYTGLVDLLGFDRAVLALAKLSDAALARAVGPTADQAAMMESPAFWEGMLRADEAYGSLRRGLRTVRRTPPPQVADSAANFSVRAMLPSAEHAHHLEFNFDADTFDRNRIAVLIGRNGVGKTQLLRRIVDVQKDMPGGADLVMDPQRRFGRVLVFSSVTSDPYPRAIPPWEGVDYEYFSMTAPTEDRGDALLQALAAIRRDNGDRIGPGQESRRDLFRRTLMAFGLFNRLSVPLKPVRNDNVFPAEFDWDGKRYFPFDAPLREQLELLLVGEFDWASSAIVFSREGPRQLSSGETAILRFLAQAVASIDRGSLLLFDEPETHLHPNYVSEFMGVLQDLLGRTQSVAIIATHSAYVVREVPRERVNVMTVGGDGRPNADAPRLQTFGASIDSISQFVFNDGGVPHWHLQRLREWIAGPGAGLTLEEIIERHGAELNPEMLSYIAELKRREPGADA